GGADRTSHNVRCWIRCRICLPRGKIMLKLLCVTAHPDDEAGGFGGTLRLYADRGVETHVICLTEGQAARNRGTAKTGEELAHMRRTEFAESCRLLQISQSTVL